MDKAIDNALELFERDRSLFEKRMLQHRAIWVGVLLHQMNEIPRRQKYTQSSHLKICGSIRRKQSLVPVHCLF